MGSSKTTGSLRGCDVTAGPCIAAPCVRAVILVHVDSWHVKHCKQVYKHGDVKVRALCMALEEYNLQRRTWVSSFAYDA